MTFRKNNALDLDNPALPKIVDLNLFSTLGFIPIILFNKMQCQAENGNLLLAISAQLRILETKKYFG